MQSSPEHSSGNRPRYELSPDHREEPEEVHDHARQHVPQSLPGFGTEVCGKISPFSTSLLYSPAVVLADIDNHEYVVNTSPHVATKNVVHVPYPHLQLRAALFVVTWLHSHEAVVVRSNDSRSRIPIFVKQKITQSRPCSWFVVIGSDVIVFDRSRLS